ncbi:ATP-binding cassette domain-containing protein [Roseospira visakhapatnamensis]|uniref:ABC-type transporter Mla maintaining outer membrane lipid asymmetry ATPase subunit MlaF/ABC-type transporter Mla maintaining outer membrane lipid asymmetry permease subunit MlaE n=1 Tax=Roseospira visakhapatnamensis TaxID=390880 RepID=A0A7W6W845_9PROT|nr:ATP-binding cassette domain-containing protein [Roseospira visakhapatnamensis]MBB4264454.1 ABC-type transporter Mla maintaining outer membrane lipid asymmetry ATPase subunit MlaF/ABC-type transporter Mla maintaining outer membrane lipid asymmetry permease subunit MlaE [Roseospira visakhapatnamensis]
MTSGPPSPALSVHGLTLGTPDGRHLLENAALTLAPGEILLLTGPSGCGKSTLLRALAGLARPGDVLAGTLVVAGHPSVDMAAAPGQAGVGALVFQTLGLFEELTVAENLAIVADHGGARAGPAADMARALVADLPPDRSPRALSGGQQQRVAIARTVLADRPVLLFDEPNAGLDGAAARALAALIARVARDLGRGVIIVAHHLDPFLPHAGQVLFMDPETRRLEPLPAERAAIEARLLTAADRDRHPPPPPTNGNDGRDHDAPPASPAAAVRAPWRRRWIGRYLREYLWSLAFRPAAVLYMGLAAVLVGFVTTWFTIQTMPYRTVLSPLILNDVLAGLGALLYRVLIPLITAILLAARAGAIVAADMGHRTHATQILAMRNLRLPERPYLWGTVTATTTVAALVYAFGLFGLASLTSAIVFAGLLDGEMDRWARHFFSQLVDADRWIPRGTGWVVVKMVLSAGAIAATALVQGLRPKLTGLDINDGISAAVTTALGSVLAIHALVALAEFS